MTMDGAPWAWIQDVSEADWPPDGTTLAIVRTEAGAVRRAGMGRAPRGSRRRAAATARDVVRITSS